MFTPKLHMSYSYMAFPQRCVWTAAGWWQYTYNLTTCNSTFINRFPHLLPYHGPEEHDHLGEEFLNYQTMPTTSLQDETEMESFWAGMATRKHKVYFFLAFFLAGVAWLHLLLLLMHAYIVSYMMQTMHVVSELCYSVLTVLIKTKYGMFFHFVLCSFSIGGRNQRIWEACCRRQAGPGVAPFECRCWEGVFSCGTEQN